MPTFSSNYYFRKYEEKLNPLKEYVDKDFSQALVIYNFDYLYSSSYDEYKASDAQFIADNKKDMYTTNKYIIIEATQTETDELEERLHSLAWRLYCCYSNYYPWAEPKTYYLISTPQSRSQTQTSFNLSKITADNFLDYLKTSEQVFAYTYEQQDRFCSLYDFSPSKLYEEDSE